MKKINESLGEIIDQHYLISLLIKKEILTKYKGSVLGLFWSLLSPLFEMIVLTLIFSQLFRHNIDNFPVYLLTGRLVFGFFSSATNLSMNTIVASASLIKKIYIPKYILIFSKLIANFIFFMISLIDLLLIMIITGADFSWNNLYAFVYLILLFFFVSGISMIFATVNVFFRDVQYLYSVFITALMYASCIFYSPDIIPKKYVFLLAFNPIFHFINGFRNVVYYGQPMAISSFLTCSALAAVSMLAGIIVLNKYQDRFVLYL